MILIETKVNGTNIAAKIRDHSLITGMTLDPQGLAGTRPHGTYLKWSPPEGGKYAIHASGAVAQLSRIGVATGVLDGADIQVHRIDVSSKYRSRGFGLALLQALLQAALTHGVELAGSAFLIADESETPGLRAYYGKMGFGHDPDYGETDDPLQYPLKARVDTVIGNIQIWRAAKYSQDPAHFVVFS